MQDLAIVHNRLLHFAEANAAGDLEGATEDGDAPERLLRFLLDVSSPPWPKAEHIRAVCNPRELLMALLEVYDQLKETAFDSPMHLLLLRLLGLVPRLVAAVQRRRLQVALSCLPAVADLAAGAAARLAACRRVAEEAEAAAAAAAVARRGLEPGQLDEQLETTAAAEDMWRQAKTQLVAPFAVFAEQMHELVLAAELPPLLFNTTTTTTTITSSTNVGAAAAVSTAVPHGTEPLSLERRRVGAWLLALCGALWSAWGPLVPLPPPPPPPSLDGSTAAGASSGSMTMWSHEACSVEYPADRTLILSHIASDPELPRLGAASLLWLATAPLAATAATATARYGARPLASRAADDGSRQGARGPPGIRWPPCLEPSTRNPRGSLKVLLEACQVLLLYAGREDSTTLLDRALQLLAAGSAVPGAPAASTAPTIDQWVGVYSRLAGRQASDPLRASELYDMLGVYEPHLDESDTALEPLAQSLATVAAVNMVHGVVGSESEARRTLAHAALQSLLGALSPPLRARCLESLAAGPSPEVSALALQRLQREVATAAAAAGEGVAAVGRSDGGYGGSGAVFSTPWVLRPVLQQLLPLLSDVAGADAAGAAADGAAADALTHRADVATAAVSVVRFLALRSQSATAAAAASTGVVNTPHDNEAHLRGAAANGGVYGLRNGPRRHDESAATVASAASGVAARAAVLGAVYETCVRPLHGAISAAFRELRRRVQLEEETSAPSSPPPHQVPAAMPATAADRFAANVAVVSDAVAGLTAISRLQEVADYVAELLGHPALQEGFIRGTVSPQTMLTQLRSPAPAQARGRPSGCKQSAVLVAAASSPSPDWRAKVEWLEAKRYPRNPEVAAAAASLPDGRDRLRWLQERGYPMGLFNSETFRKAGRAGNFPLVQYLLQEFVLYNFTRDAAEAAAEAGQLDFLKALHALCQLDSEASRSLALHACRSGHQAVVAWAVQELQYDVSGDPEALSAAAESGNVALMAWIWARSQLSSGKCMEGAVKSGCREALQWMEEHGLLMKGDLGTMYYIAARNEIRIEFAVFLACAVYW
ncbi:hypothetical protein VOLCADRAFT_95889 [Volvox carteri f. nagariensis]|uniref:Uncharacterized protein n=1 Tax=Volvox carteri f. nagariensis TaxID=3068 RepID=D8U8M7_VOLCA|nr:uncharacterized protein VOLCADRAFT_95889 [Volvox carteri f. nagariensis]EFJ44009.1 hypothetical protein VOLCADRAFT_95889 [Volvox carteri f. nagariensis]|eukprot:XP_002955021.1 hypothetical protein VOLCADRAFT_95889 [Volvox carteri f. nagariensis]